MPSLNHHWPVPSILTCVNGICLLAVYRTPVVENVSIRAFGWSCSWPDLVWQPSSTVEDRQKDSFQIPKPPASFPG